MLPLPVLVLIEVTAAVYSLMDPSGASFRRAWIMIKHRTVRIGKSVYQLPFVDIFHHAMGTFIPRREALRFIVAMDFSSSMPGRLLPPARLFNVNTRAH